MHPLNIFILDENPLLAAVYANDTHVSKMVTETAQILSTATRTHTPFTSEELDVYTNLASPGMSGREAHKLRQQFCNDRLPNLYKSTHERHPSVLWVSRSRDNYLWTVAYFEQLAAEYEYRFGKSHQAFTKIFPHVKNPPPGLYSQQFSTLTIPTPVISPDLFREYHYLINGRHILNTTTNGFRTDGLNTNEDFLFIPGEQTASWGLSVEFYRKYYYTNKLHISRWSKRDVPSWFKEPLLNQGYEEAQIIVPKSRSKPERIVKYMSLKNEKHSDQ